jgi:hypothetical protein
MAKERKNQPHAPSPGGGEHERRHAPSRPGHEGGDGKHAGHEHHRPPSHRREEPPPQREPEPEWPMERSPADELGPDSD